MSPKKYLLISGCLTILVIGLVWLFSPSSERPGRITKLPHQESEKGEDLPSPSLPLTKEEIKNIVMQTLNSHTNPNTIVDKLSPLMKENIKTSLPIVMEILHDKEVTSEKKTALAFSFQVDSSFIDTFFDLAMKENDPELRDLLFAKMAVPLLITDPVRKQKLLQYIRQTDPDTQFSLFRQFIQYDDGKNFDFSGLFRQLLHDPSVEERFKSGLRLVIMPLS